MQKVEIIEKDVEALQNRTDGTTKDITNLENKMKKVEKMEKSVEILQKRSKLNSQNVNSLEGKWTHHNQVLINLLHLLFHSFALNILLCIFINHD